MFRCAGVSVQHCDCVGPDSGFPLTPPPPCAGLQSHPLMDIEEEAEADEEEPAPIQAVAAETGERGHEHDYR